MGRSRGGFGTKIHLVTDGTGLPLSFCLSDGQAHESQFAKALLNRVGVIRKSGWLKTRLKAVLADKGYSGTGLRRYLKIKGIKAVIPFKSNEKARQDRSRRPDWQLYKKRNVVEGCFAVLKENRPHRHAFIKNSEKLPEHVKTEHNQIFFEAFVRLRDTAW